MIGNWLAAAWAAAIIIAVAIIAVMDERKHRA